MCCKENTHKLSKVAAIKTFSLVCLLLVQLASVNVLVFMRVYHYPLVFFKCGGPAHSPSQTPPPPSPLAPPPKKNAKKVLIFTRKKKFFFHDRTKNFLYVPEKISYPFLKKPNFPNEDDFLYLTEKTIFQTKISYTCLKKQCSYTFAKKLKRFI